MTGKQNKTMIIDQNMQKLTFYTRVLFDTPLFYKSKKKISISNGLSKTSSLHTVTQGTGSKPDKTMNLMEVEVENTEDLCTSKCENCYLQSQKYLLQLFHNYLAMKLSDGLDI